MSSQMTILKVIDTKTIQIVKETNYFYIQTNNWRSSPTSVNCVTISETQIWRNIYNSLIFKKPPYYTQNRVVYIKGFPLVKI